MSNFLSTREERLQLERERLERQNKRLREESERREGKGKGKSTDEDVDSQRNEPPAKKARLNGTSLAQTGDASSSSHLPVYWNGIVRQTANMHADKDKDTRPTIRLSDIITPVSPCFSPSVTILISLVKKEDIEFAITASYASMPNFIFSFFDTNTPVISVVQPDESGTSRVIKLREKFLLTTPFLRGGRGCQHIKVCPRTLIPCSYVRLN
jgi:tyrosyl-DNA phosphodiesterase-1